ncbi:hypothetical protein EB796_015187 [Bugula neritina]|uniref:Uncharacterized protein n=1 Tax=Bugula neritina TaxID=10212 RepID=A0A7J7JLG4_BUGNE|nr:hypothetical protein EB796_015187 [Bugula neritina]
MGLNTRSVGVVLLSSAFGATLIALLAAFYKQKKSRSLKPPDVLNEARPLDESLQLDEGARDDEPVGLSDRSLSGSRKSLTPGSPSLSDCTLQQLCHLGKQHLVMSEKLWQEALVRSSLEASFQTVSIEHLRSLHAKVRELLVLYQTEFEADVVIDTTISALQEMDKEYERRKAKSIASDETSLDTFVSAPETPDLTDLEEKISDVKRHPLYEAGLLELQHNSVPYRKLRTTAVGCQSDSEFLAKLHVIRIALDKIMKVDSNRKWFMETGKRIITCILNKAQRDPSDFLLAMDKLEEFIPIESNFDILKAELGMRGVKCFTLYDVVLDWVLMDAFDDLTNPPSSVLSVVQNRWLSAGLKETAISTAVWSILKAKRRILKYPEGFISRFYAISESVSPILAWAFLGPDSDVKSACMCFKNHSLGFIQDLFNQDTVRYSVYEEITSDIMSAARCRAESILSVIDNS